MKYGEGFYQKNADNSVLYAPNAVCGQNFEIFKEMKASYEYPIHGWTWYDSGEEAFKAFGLEMPKDNIPRKGR